MELGAQIRRLRLAAGQSLAALAEAGGCSKSHLSRIESGLSSPSIALLARIAGALGTEPGTLLSAAGTPRTLSLVRAHERLALSRGQEDRGYSYAAIAHPKADRQVEAYVIELESPEQNPRAGEGPLFCHPGQELFFVLEGEILFRHGEEEHLIGPGDTLFFDADHPHRAYAHGAGTARALAVIIPPERPARGAATEPSDTGSLSREENDNDRWRKPGLSARRA